MIDPVVERQYSDCKELLALWRTFHDFFVMGIKGEMLIEGVELGGVGAYLGDAEESNVNLFI